MKEVEFLYTVPHHTLKLLLFYFRGMAWLNTDAFPFLSSEALFHHKMAEKDVERINKFTKVNRALGL